VPYKVYFENLKAEYLTDCFKGKDSLWITPLIPKTQISMILKLMVSPITSLASMHG
jgi:hypothetical protein